ncbi:MAG: acyl carrier protein [Opitutales bacterium]|jgi:acyl carrier protein
MDTFIENLSMGLNAPDLTILPDNRLADLPNWDSLAILTTLSMIDMEYRVTLTGTDLQNCNTVADLFAMVEKRKG